jgi:hypothetical protein
LSILNGPDLAIRETVRMICKWCSRIGTQLSVSLSQTFHKIRSSNRQGDPEHIEIIDNLEHIEIIDKLEHVKIIGNIEKVLYNVQNLSTDVQTVGHLVVIISVTGPDRFGRIQILLIF